MTMASQLPILERDKASITTRVGSLANHDENDPSMITNELPISVAVKQICFGEICIAHAQSCPGISSAHVSNVNFYSDTD